MLFLPLAIAPLLAHAAPKEVWWNITYATANPDGLFKRRAIGVNGSWPPPPIEISINDTLRVHATNNINVPTSLHHHGLLFKSMTYHDGVVGVTQCGIPVGQTFIYDVPVSGWSQWGTYWVHAHWLGQYVDGLRAPLVVHRNADFLANPVGADFSKSVTPSMPEAYAYDMEYTVILGDWYHAEHDRLIKPGGPEPVPDSGLIYFAQNGAYLPPRSDTNFPFGAVGFNENSSIIFEPGKTYRLRILNTAAFAMFHFWIEGHDMRIIEADGTDVEEYPINVLPIATGQRYSVLISALNETNLQNWIIHANMDTYMFSDMPESLNPNITSFITYSNSSLNIYDSSTASSTIPNNRDLPDEKLVPLERIPIGKATREIRLEVDVEELPDGLDRATFNGVSWEPPIVPSWFTAWNNLSDYGPGSYVVKKGEIVDLTVVNLDRDDHPFHLHGHKFAIMNRVGGKPSKAPPHISPPLSATLENPMRRDTIEIPGGGSVTLRWEANNPGAWIFHCHIDWHLSTGLAVVFVEDPEGIRSLPRGPQYMFDQCHSLDIPTEGHDGDGGLEVKTESMIEIEGWWTRCQWRWKGVGVLLGWVLVILVWTRYAHGGRYTRRRGEARLLEESEIKMGKRVDDMVLTRR